MTSDHHNQIAPANASDTLPALIDRAASALAGARTSAEVLEARDMARMAYDAAKFAGRMARAKEAHDVVIAAVYRAQADAAIIEARAKVRLADEYDAAQARGEVAGVGNPSIIGDDKNRPTAAELGLRSDEIHEARKLRDAEAAQPGKIEAAAEALIERGEEPTKAALKREVLSEHQSATDSKARSGLAKLTREGLEDEVVGLREALAAERARRKALEAERDQLKARLADLEADDQHAVVLRLTGELKNMRVARFRAEEKAAAFHRQIFKLKQQLGIRADEEIEL